MASPQPMSEIDASRRRGVRNTVAVLLIIVVIFLGGFIYRMVKPQVLSDSELRANNTYVFKTAHDIGSFSLIDDNGQPFTSVDVRGKWSLVYFGYTFCPDVCPTTMAQLSQFYSKLEPKYAKDTQIIMVSVDPARDDAAKMHEYVRYFNPKFRGVTGEFLTLQKLAASLNTPFSKIPGGGENYQIEHGDNIAIIDSRGRYVGFFRAPHELSRLLTSYRSIRMTHP